MIFRIDSCCPVSAITPAAAQGLSAPRVRLKSECKQPSAAKKRLGARALPIPGANNYPSRRSARAEDVLSPLIVTYNDCSLREMLSSLRFWRASASRPIKPS